MARPATVAWALCAVVTAGGSITVGGIAATRGRPGPDVSVQAAAPPGKKPAALPGEQAALPVAVNHGDPSATISDTDLNALVSARNKALQNHDRQAFLALVDPKQTDVLAQQGRLFDNLQKIHFDSADYAVGGDDSTETTFASQARATVDVDFEHRISGVDPAPVVERYRWTVKRTGPGGALRITAVDGAPGSGTAAAYYPAPWDVVSGLTVINRPHVLLMADATSASYAAGVADDAASAASFDLGHWTGGSGTAPGFSVFLTSDRSVYGKLYGSDSRGWDVGVTFPLAVSAGDQSYKSSRIVIDTTDEKKGNGDISIVMRHEMTHAMVFPLEAVGYGQDHTWVDEGFAEWMSYRVYDDSLVLQAIANSGDAPSGTPGHLPEVSEVYADAASTAQKNYALAQLAIMYMASKYGADKVDRFVASVYQNSASSNAVDGAMQSVLGTTTAQFTQGWAAYVRSHA